MVFSFYGTEDGGREDDGQYGVADVRSVYTASSVAYLIDLFRKRFFKPEDAVVYLCTGDPRRSSHTRSR